MYTKLLTVSWLLILYVQSDYNVSDGYTLLHCSVDESEHTQIICLYQNIQGLLMSRLGLNETTYILVLL